MLDIARLCNPAVCLTIPDRYPHRTDPLIAKWEEYGVKPTCLVNSPLEIPRVRPGDASLRVGQTMPSGFPDKVGHWRHATAMVAAIRTAANAGHDSILILEDDCILTDQFESVCRAVTLPESWDLLYFGAWHEYASTEFVSENLLRVKGSFCTHAVLIHRRAFPLILDKPIDRQGDIILVDHVHPRGQSYALWPSVAIQAHGLSSICGLVVNEPEKWDFRGREIR